MNLTKPSPWGIGTFPTTETLEKAYKMADKVIKAAKEKPAIIVILKPRPDGMNEPHYIGSQISPSVQRVLIGVSLLMLFKVALIQQTQDGRYFRGWWVTPGGSKYQFQAIRKPSVKQNSKNTEKR